MPGATVLTGFSASDPVPGAYTEIRFAQGDVAGDGSALECLLIGNKTAAGSATVDAVVYGPDSPVPLRSEADAIALFGAGSELHRMFRRFTSINRSTTVRAIAVTASGGTAASKDVVFANNATGAGSATLWVCDESVEISIVSGDTPTALGDLLVAAVNAQTHWPLTASNSSGTVTLTAKIAGPRGNQIRVQTRITSGIATTLTLGADTPLASGATADSSTTALATILPKRYYWIASAANDATQLGALVTQVNSQALPVTGIRQQVFAGSVDTLANTITIATGRNSARCCILWNEQSSYPTAELAAIGAAITSLFQVKPSPRCNFAGFGNDAVTQAAWPVLAQRDVTAHPLRSEIVSALNNGISPIGINPNGTTYLVDLITSRSLNGSVNDYRIRDQHKVTISDFFADDLTAKEIAQHSGKKLANDPPSGARPPGADVLTPSVLRSTVFGLIDDYDANSLFQDVAKMKADTIVQREVSPTSRISVRCPLRPIDVAKQFANLLEQVA